MNQSECEPLLKWAGGKRRLLRDILPFAPKTFGRYYEPFVGGGAVFFSIQPKSATLSDTNSELIGAYLQVRDNLDAVLRCLRRLPNSEEDYYRIRKSSPSSDAGKAARLIYLCKLSFNGIYRQNLSGKFNVPYGQKHHIDPCNETLLRRISSLLRGTKIISADFEAAVAHAKAGDFVYFDPPYTVAHGNNGFLKYNAKIFSWKDQERLATVARSLRAKGCSVLVSNADHSSIHKLYPDFKVHIVERHSVMAASRQYRRPVTELLFHGEQTC